MNVTSLLPFLVSLFNSEDQNHSRTILFLVTCLTLIDPVTLLKTLKNFWNYIRGKQYRYIIQFNGMKHYSIYGNQKISIFATPGFIALNSFLVKHLRNDNISSLTEVEEILLHQPFDVKETTTLSDEKRIDFQIKSKKGITINDPTWKNIYFTIEEKPAEIQRERTSSITDDISKLELKVMSNHFNVKQLTSKCDKVFQLYEDEKLGRLQKDLYIFQFMGYSKSKKQNVFEHCLFQSNIKMKHLLFEEKRTVMKHVDFFMENKEWYHERGRPYTLGICTYGPPGCGKTSFEKALAHYMNRHLILIDFDKVENERQLCDIFYNKCIGNFEIPFDKRLYLFPDIDRTNDILYKEISRKKPLDKIEIPHALLHKLEENNITEGDIDNFVYKKLNLSQILNVIDGIMERTGQVFVMSANHPEKLDDALLRPGRIDCKIHFMPFSIKFVYQYVENFFGDMNYNDFNEFLKNNKDNISYKFTPSKLFELCVNCNGDLKRLEESLLLE